MTTSALLPFVSSALVALAVLTWPPGTPRSQPFVAATGRSRSRAVVLAVRRRWRSGSGAREITVPDVLDLIALALEAGASTGGALRAAADRLPGLTGAELRSVAAALEWGLPEEAAWSAAPPRWDAAGRALRLAARAGVPPAGLLRRAADDARRERLNRLETATARLGVRLVLPLGLAFLPGFVLTTVVPVVLALAGALLGGAGGDVLGP
ncbi:type II secretion system F family protein [Ornithinimicrobium cavernae]|uniref:type II secretion system F family protein n=1 Tax=Ornithinimicrobium cavernae TaxID=2666047 RepID=UPI000D68FB9B|nr:type II secretion system F family protein [Ornithinimicrobium cavernae]